MIVRGVELKNYRNYNYASITFHKGINILYGDNAQGKTNILESIYVCATTKSHRCTKDKELIQFDQEESHIRMYVEKKDVVHRLDMHLKKNKPKGAAIDGIPVKKTSEFIGMIHVVLFSPEDLSIIKNGPSERRRFMDMVLCQLDKVYLYDLTNYNKVLNQRNKLLKQISFSGTGEETLEIWDLQLIKYGKEIVRRREEFLDMLGKIVIEIHKNLTGNREKMTILYETNAKLDEYQQLVEEKRKKDLKMMSTGIGPHRDDICFMVNGIDIRKFGSQGQQRTAALSLKLAEIVIAEKIMKEKPVLLLDDVLSELDQNRKEYLLESIKDIQTIITCTGVDEFVKSRLHLDKIFEIKNGEISEG